MYYKKRDSEKKLIIAINLTPAQDKNAEHVIEKNLTLIDFKLIEGALLYMVVNPEDNFFKLMIRSLKKGQASFEFFNLFPRKP